MLGSVGRLAIRRRFCHLAAATGCGRYKTSSLPTKPNARLQEVLFVFAMTIRLKLNLAVTALIIIFVITAAFAMRAVRENAEFGDTFSRMRELTDMTSNIHSGIYRHLAASGGLVDAPESANRAGWLVQAMRETDTQARLAQSDEERELWSDLRRALSALEDAHAGRDAISLSASKAAALAEASIGSLRSLFNLAEYNAAASASKKNLRAQQVIWVSASLTLLLFLLYVIMIRNWLVKPIELLQEAADAIGGGDLHRRIPLAGGDELSQLARRIEAMAGKIAAHQTALLRARELSVIGNLCTNVADGLRNPLSALRASVAPVTTRDADPDQLATTLKNVMRQVDRMDERITKLFEFSRSRELNWQWSTFHQIAITAHAHTRSLLQSRDVELKIEDDTNDSRWFLDCDELAEALAELIINAVQRSAAGGGVVLRGTLLPSVADSGQRLQIEVVDHGSGMAPDELDKAFDLFFTSRPDGVGMGLAIVRRMIERHAGEVTLESEISKGTRATIVLSRRPDSSQ